MPAPTSTVPANTAANQLPELPAGPSLEFVRGPIEIPLFETWQLICISLLSAVLISILANWLIRFLRTRTKPVQPSVRGDRTPRNRTGKWR